MFDVDNHWSTIHGHFNFQPFYDKMVEIFPDGSNFCEVGVYHGCSVAYLASRIMKANKKIKIYCVDIYRELYEDKDIYPDFLKNMEPYGDIIVPIRGRSMDTYCKFPNNFFDMVYIDANHEYENVKNDILKWSLKVKQSGIIAGHDYRPEGEPDSFPGVGKAVREIYQTNFTTIDNTWIRTTELHPKTLYTS